jgi:hypothetical protein
MAAASEVVEVACCCCGVDVLGDGLADRLVDPTPLLPLLPARWWRNSPASLEQDKLGDQSYDHELQRQRLTTQQVSPIPPVLCKNTQTYFFGKTLVLRVMKLQ